MRITHIGHACFFIDSHDARVVTDPFEPSVPYPFPIVSADVVTVSHDHHDHNAVDRVGGSPVAVRGPGLHRVAGLEIQGIASSHDDAAGGKRGPNTIFAFTVEGVRLAHLGDLGTPLDKNQQAALRGVGVLFLPVGGYYTIDAAQAGKVMDSLADVRLVIPMHYRTRLVSDWPIAPVDAFLETKDNVRHIGSSDIILTKATLPETVEVWVLDHA